MMTIGEFSLHTGIGVKALRFYDERGVLPAAEVDQATGYRFYAAGQLRAATTIRVLRAAGMSLESVEQVLQQPDRAVDLLTSHERQLQAQREVQDRAIRIGQGMLADSGQQPDVQTRQVGLTHWAAIATTVRVADGDIDDADWQNSHFQRLHTALTQAGNPPTGGWWTAIDSADAGDVEVLLSWPVREAVPEDFSLDGVELRRGTLPERTEAFVRTELDEVEDDLLDDAAGGRLLHPKYLDFVEYLEKHGHQLRQLRQAAILNDAGTPVVLELTATISS
jgi:DNA-binding transcriptional MerR regulator